MVRRILGPLAVVLLSACVSKASSDLNSLSNPIPESFRTDAVELKDTGPAPELATSIWLNSDQPLALVDLQGMVVQIDFWTFG